MKPSNCSGAAAILSDSLVFCFLMGDASRISQTGTVSTFVVEVELVQREILLVDVRTFGVCVGGGLDESSYFSDLTCQFQANSPP
jgi:hypothetical protein